MTGSEFYSDFGRSSENSAFTVRGPESARIALKIDSKRLYVVVAGEPRGNDLTQCFREGLDKGLIRPSMRTLVDLTRFTGTVDWSAVFALRTLAPWGKDEGESRVAYVVRTNTFLPLLKIARVLFFRSHHRAFDNHADAIKWLESVEMTE